MAHPETVPLDFLEVMIAGAAVPGTGHTAYTMLRAVTTLRGYRPELLLRDDLAHLPVPTLFLWGDADAFGRPSIGRDVAARMPNARFEVLPDTGHLPHVDRPDSVAAAIIEFLGSSNTAPGSA